MKEDKQNSNEVVGEVHAEPKSEDVTDNKTDNVEVEVKTTDLGTTVTIHENIPDHVQSVGRKTPSHLTDQGFFDLKFYHNKLW